MATASLKVRSVLENLVPVRSRADLNVSGMPDSPSQLPRMPPTVEGLQSLS